MARWTGNEDATHFPSKHMLNVKEHENNTGEPQANELLGETCGMCPDIR